MHKSLFVVIIDNQPVPVEPERGLEEDTVVAEIIFKERKSIF